MLLNESGKCKKQAFGECNNIFLESFVKFDHNNQLLSDYLYHINKYNKLKKKNKGPKHTYTCRSGMFSDFCIRTHMHSASSYEVMKSNLTRVRQENC